MMTDASKIVLDELFNPFIDFSLDGILIRKLFTEEKFRGEYIFENG